MDTDSLNSELNKFALVYFYFHFIFVLFQKKGRYYDICIFYLIASEFCISLLFPYLVVEFSCLINIRLDETKNMTLSSKLIFLSVILVPCFLSLKGEILNLKPDYQGVLDALDFAMNKLNDKGSNVNRFMSTKVQEATLQVKT